MLSLLVIAIVFAVLVTAIAFTVAAILTDAAFDKRQARRSTDTRPSAARIHRHVTHRANYRD